MPDTPRYRAFLSYSHTDTAIAVRLHKRWENFRIGKDLVGIDTPIGPVPDSLRPIFIDRGDFAPGAELRKATREALENADALIVLASPEAAASPYVDAEIRLFRELHPDRPVAPLILRGSAAQSFPPSLETGTLAADWAKDGHDRAAAKIVADIEAIVRQYAPIGSAQAAPLTEALKSIVAGAATNPKYAQALVLLQGGKPAEAEPLLREAAREMEARDKLSIKQTAEAYRTLGAIAGLRDPKAALEAYAKAVELDPDNADALYWAGWLQKESGNLAAAERAYLRLLALPSGTQYGDHAFWSRSGLGDIALARGNLPDALRSYRDGLAIADRLAKADPGNAGWQFDLGISNERLWGIAAPTIVRYSAPTPASSPG